MRRAEDEAITRRAELGNFLRTRRARLSPKDASLPESGRRRAPGLRREDVAQLANISTTWYTWLEQGRDIHMSTRTLDGIARALRLDAEERAHLFLLAQRQSPPGRPPVSELVPAAVQRVLDDLEGCAAHVKGRRWDMLAWNQTDRLVFCDYEALPTQERNILWIMFTHAPYQKLLVDWEQETQRALAQFRADSGRHIDDPWFVELIVRLQAASPEFSRWWSRHDVLGRPAGRKELSHPVVGRLVLESTVFNVAESPELKLVIHTPLPDANSERKIRELLCQHRGAGSRP